MLSKPCSGGKVVLKSSDIMIWRYALLDFVNDFCRLVGTLGFEVISLCFRGFVYHELVQVSPTLMKRYHKLWKYCSNECNQNPRD
jgi:hypothetical protein